MAQNPNQNENLVRELKFKVIFVGFPRIGKTSIINRVVNNAFEETTTPTNRVSQSSYTQQIEGENIILDIYDAPGEQQPTAYMPNYFRNVDAVVMVYDTTNRESFNLLKETMNRLAILCDKPLRKIALFIVGNKTDLPIVQLQVNHEEANQFSDCWGATFIQTSAKCASNIDVLFENIAQQVFNYFKNSKNSNNSNRSKICKFL